MKGKTTAAVYKKYVLSAAAVALVLLLLNLGVFGYFAVIMNQQQNPNKWQIARLSDSLKQDAQGYRFTDDGTEIFEHEFIWAFLVNASGEVIWKHSCPAEIKDNYTAAEIAGFSRWYLEDYPVYVWEYQDGGLLVLGKEKDSIWKGAIEIGMPALNTMIRFAPFILLLNILAALLLAFLFGQKLIKSVRPLMEGILDMAGHKPVHVSGKGVFGELAEKINQTSAQLKKQEELLNKRDLTRTSWIAGVSHDIRTPLSIVMGYASRLEENQELPGPAREQAGIIRRRSEEIKELVSNLNLASKLEYELQPLREEKVCPGALLRETAVDFLNGGLADIYRIEINLDDTLDRSWITGDRQLLKRALVNLINNSIGHNEQGCTIRISGTAEGGACRISVADDGIGFSAETLRALSGQTAGAVQQIKSHGLGLTLVRQIVAAHGGEVSFCNRSGGGCEVILSIPVES